MDEDLEINSDVRQRYYTVQEVAQRLRVTPQAIRTWLRSGELAGIRLGNKWRITEADLERFIEARRQK